MRHLYLAIAVVALLLGLTIAIPAVGVERTEQEQNAALDVLCMEVFASAACPTPTHDHGGGTVTGWHPPGSHDGLNVHEHGAAPPDWVLTSGHAPFTQTREGHTGYKGVAATSANGVSDLTDAQLTVELWYPPIYVGAAGVG